MTRVAKIDALLKEAMGLDSTSIGTASVERAVRARMTTLGATTLREYWQALMATPTELQELIELVVVPETWFFRDAEAFAELARIATREERATPGLRVLSLPCSTGEEPYTIAMALTDAGLPAGSFTIDAVDISERAIAFARRAIYGKNSFRGSKLAFRNQHFTSTEQGYRLNDNVRQAVRFHHGNVQADDFLVDAEPYDAIFCRNLLIYFNHATQRKTAAVLERLLGTAGALFVGPAETSLFLDRDFVSAKVPLAFVLRRTSKAAARAPARSCAPAPPALAAKAVPVRVARQPAAKRASAPASTPPSAAALGRAFELADQGRLADAAALCQADLNERGPSAQGFYLLGVIYSADGLLSAAARCFRKALYLDSQHHDALLHLAALLEEQGERNEATILRRRAQRM
jgi:chemotaxis protein methyltransferase WspC